jgi:hypothetical protein
MAWFDTCGSDSTAANGIAPRCKIIPNDGTALTIAKIQCISMAMPLILVLSERSLITRDDARGCVATHLGRVAPRSGCLTHARLSNNVSDLMRACACDDEESLGEKA